MILQDIHIKTFAEGFRDRIFDTEVVAALGHTLGDKVSEVRYSTIKFFTAAAAQGMALLI